MNADNKRLSAPTSDPCLSASIRGFSFIDTARLNLAVHRLSGEWSGATWMLPQERPKGERGGAHQIKQGNTYYEDLQDSVGRFDHSERHINNVKP